MARPRNKRQGRSFSVYLDGYTAEVLEREADAAELSIGQYLAGVATDHALARADAEAPREHILKILRESPRALSVSDIAERVGADLRSTRAVIRVLTQAKLAVGISSRTPDGLGSLALFKATPKPKPVEPKPYSVPPETLEYLEAIDDLDEDDLAELHTA